LGHDIQPHSVTHPWFPDLSHDEQKAEIRNSIEFVRKIHSGPYVFCYPFNAIPTPQPIVEELSAAGFYSSGVNFNLLAEGLDRFTLRSWAIEESDFDLIVRQLNESVPDNAWIVFGLHSLDGEGWAPWTSASLSRLIAAVRDVDYQIVTVAEMIGEIAAIS
jgi:peptidoglycan/xylan/chitin deacetylase (PgdA/CDA1 family)